MTRTKEPNDDDDDASFARASAHEVVADVVANVFSSPRSLVIARARSRAREARRDDDDWCAPMRCVPSISAD